MKIDLNKAYNMIIQGFVAEDLQGMDFQEAFLSYLWHAFQLLYSQERISDH